jgi:hypothetical protein
MENQKNRALTKHDLVTAYRIVTLCVLTLLVAGMCKLNFSEMPELRYAIAVMNVNAGTNVVASPDFDLEEDPRLWQGGYDHIGPIDTSMIYDTETLRQHARRQVVNGVIRYVLGFEYKSLVIPLELSCGNSVKVAAWNGDYSCWAYRGEYDFSPLNYQAQQLIVKAVQSKQILSMTTVHVADVTYVTLVEEVVGETVSLITKYEEQYRDTNNAENVVPGYIHSSDF